jgi:hypothetical protein
MDPELKQVIDELKALVMAFSAAMTGLPVANNGPGTTVPVVVEEPYPRDVEFEGAKFHLFRPINPKWKPSQAAKMFGKHHLLDDPSLATTPNGYPSRSPAGYPLIYPFVKDGHPYKPAVILFGENTFPDDAAVEEYIKATSVSAEEMERIRKQWEKYDEEKKRLAAGGGAVVAPPPSNPRPDHGGGTVTPPSNPNDDVVIIV